MAESIGELKGKLSSVFEKNGSLSALLPDFEPRPGQKEMSNLVFRSFAEECHAIIEAGTGTGKTLAYLFPAILFSLAYKEPVLISTRTINLQEQLLYKDIPLAREVLGEQFRAVLVKGWSNYLCLRRFNNLKVSEETFDINELKGFRNLEKWAEKTATGDKSDIDFVMPESLWDRVMAEPSTCTNRKCQYYGRCFFMSSRKKLKDASILVTNHALLFSHIASRKNSSGAASMTLPDFKRLILDEAHHIEEVASNFMGDEASSSDFYKILDSLFHPHRKRPDSGILARIKSVGFSSMIDDKIKSLLDLQCIPGVQLLKQSASEFYFKTVNLPVFESSSDKIRLTPFFKEQAAEIDELLDSFTRNINDFKKSLFALREEVLREDDDDLAGELGGIISKIESYRDSLVRVWNAEDNSWIYSLEYTRRESYVSVRFKSYPLLVSDALYEDLFKPLKTAILTSATLTVNQNFKFLTGHLGLDRFEKDFVLTKIIDSPFDYKNQAVFAVATDLPLSGEENFVPMIIPHLVETINLMEGRTFLLFTSYRMLQSCGDLLREKFDGSDFTMLIQGESPSNILLEKFRETDKAVLLGTDSFWEGVDVPGRDLECVIMMKLPFKVPTDPIIQARAEHIKKQGQDPFTSYYVPQAVIKFKQGFGRLIRNSKDRGIIIIPDKRILEKSYGQTFLKSLPPCRTIKGSFAGITSYVEEWLKKRLDNKL